eukprot:CAMPEP_0182928120 /NCGR_PEP_ID=MMETSP0105_2-20130417/15271_1 /TAXON_ID=81532 ORGANISM="Acanthoeca-like sp., Strain 10tr" /NCGR_SAMPLE_ID=MMETSP0105_2 /ASSEMBLY_ACC=CAM_ASM_000205 /LENGTH=439 /DNA_ID=CAMNT_0025066111 /DNA_START=31 /DNA_END=1350 /DNA_ORIENTATION=+
MAAAPAAAEGKQIPRVKQVRAYVTTAETSGDQGADCHDVGLDHWINGLHPWKPIANPMSGYSQYKGARTSWGINVLGTLVVEIEADDGTCGVGVTTGGEPAAYIVEKHLSRFVEGQDPRDIELMWDQMFRSTLNYGRKGLPLQAISAVDLALWDLLGNIRGEPVYALLGGKTKDRLPVYCTSARPDISCELGFVGAKVPCPYGPADGDEGFRKNVEAFKEYREKVDKIKKGFPIALDCYMSLSVPYAIKLAKALEPYGLKWIEEALPPDDYDGYAEIKRALAGVTLVTTGEHEYSRYGFRELIDRKAIDILQPDVTWMGGLTEARRITAMASAHDIMVIPHGSSAYSFHLQFAFRNSPIAEIINLSPGADKIAPYFGGLFPDEPLPKDGWIDVPTKPGFGMTLKRDGLHRVYDRPASDSEKNYKSNAERPLPEVPHMPF